MSENKKTSRRPLPELFGEKDYPEKMRTCVAGWRRQHLRSGRMTSYDGTLLQYYYAVRPDAKGSIVCMHGYCEFIGKYRELLYYFYQEGYNVFFHEHRGHGRSSRSLGVGMENVYIRTYHEYEKDLKYLLDHKYLPLLKAMHRARPLFLFAHSMGGAVASLFLEDYPAYFDAAILSSPMHEMVMGRDNMPAWKIYSALTYARLSRKDKQPLPGSKGFNPDARAEDSNAMSEVRFLYTLNQRKHYPEYRTSSPTYGWIRASLTAQKRIQKNAGRVQVPVLLLQAGKDALVKPGAQLAFAAHSRHTQVIRFEGARHELMNAAEDIREQYYRAIFHFLNVVKKRL